MSFDHVAAAQAVAAVAGEHATRVDETAAFPSHTVDAAREHGLLGLLSSTDVGGHGLGPRQAAEVIETIAQQCASSAMVLTMHYSGTAVIEAHGGDEVRRAIAAGDHLSTLAFSESGSRSHFWAPTSTAKQDGDSVFLDARKSWVTSASHATAYVWSSGPIGEGVSSIWLVPADSEGLSVSGGFDGLGLRGNDSCPVAATGVRVPASASLGGDGKGFDVMMGNVLPLFNLLISAGSVGIAGAAVTASAEHASGARYAHIDSALRDFPTIRAYLAKMSVKVASARGLLLDTLTAMETGRADTMLRVLQCKAGCGDMAIEVTDTAMRVCGGAAFRKDVGVERRFRDARAAAVMAPTSDQLYDFVGKALTGMELFA